MRRLADSLFPSIAALRWFCLLQRLSAGLYACVCAVAYGALSLQVEQLRLWASPVRPVLTPCSTMLTMLFSVVLCPFGAFIWRSTTRLVSSALTLVVL